MARLKDNHPQRDFFIPDMFDSLGASFKDDMASMEHPIFVLSKNKDMRQLDYQKDNVKISIIPSIVGLPTIFDKDILLYCASMLMAEVNAGRTPPKVLRVSCRDLLASTNRRTDGRSYERLKTALDRLTGVHIKTNIKTNKREITRGFGVFDYYEVIESSKIKNRMVRLEICVSDWFYNSILGKEVLTINRDYFLLGKPMERRLYEIARKFCGQSQQWKIELVNLMEKTGSTATLRKFRLNVKTIAEDDHIPDYAVSFEPSTDMVTFTNRNIEGKTQEILPLDDIPAINRDTIRKAQRIVSDAGTGWNFYTIQEEFTLSLMDGFRPKSVNGAFINFVKKKVATTP